MLATLGGCLMGDAVAREAVVHQGLGSVILGGIRAHIVSGVLGGSMMALTVVW